MWKASILSAALVLTAGTVASAAETTVTVNQISADGVGEEIGTVLAEDSPYGLKLTPDLSGMEPGPYGFHIHENPSCDPGEKEGEIAAGIAAGSHYDPAESGNHEGPYGQGHQGDLSVLVVNEDGTATIPVLAPRLTVADVRGRSLMIHEGSDNYSDMPEELGGGGGRIACGLFE